MIEKKKKKEAHPEQNPEDLNDWMSLVREIKSAEGSPANGDVSVNQNIMGDDVKNHS